MSAAIVMLFFFLLLGGAVVGTGFQNFAVWKLALFGIPFLGIFLSVLFAKDRLRYLLLVAVLALPFLGLKVPPARFGLTVLDVLSVPVALLLLVEKVRRPGGIRLLPLGSALPALLLLVPSLVVSVHEVNSLWALLTVAELYLFFILLVHYLRDQGSWQAIHVNLSLALIIVTIFVFIEKATGTNFNFGAPHMGQFMQINALKIHRVAGIFQDPQKAAQFMAVFMSYLAILLGRRAFRHPAAYAVVGLAVALSVPALVITVTRMAIISGLAMTAVGLILFIRAGFMARFYLAIGGIAAAASIVMAGVRMETVFPDEVVKRFEQTDQAIDGRLKVWRDTMELFGPRLLTGVGPGNYKEFMMQQDPRLRRVEASGGYVADMPESGYLKILYEVGMVGAIGVLLLVGHLGWRILETLFGTRQHLPVSAILASSAGLLVFMATFVTIYTVADMRNAFIVPFMAASALSAGAWRLQETKLSPVCGGQGRS